MQQAADDRARERQLAFESLERVSRELDASYRDLEARVARLNDELAATRSARLEELAEKERLLERLASLMAMLPGGVLLVDDQQQVRDANPAAMELLGEPLIGAPWGEVQQRIDADRSRFLSIMQRQLAPEEETVVLITDTTEVHELQAQVGREQRLSALGEMAARLAHQIRTPLSSTTLYLAQLRRDDLDARQRRRICDRLTDRLSHMEGLVNGMLSFLRGSNPEVHELNLQDVLADLAAVVQAPVRDAAARFHVTPVDRSLCLRGSREDLVGALANLVVNALESAAPTGGECADGAVMERVGNTVSVSVWAGAVSAEALQLRVRDNGPGVPDDIAERIFDPFFTTRSAGTGLGLAVVSRTIADHGGSIRLERPTQGGAEFVVTLPIAATGGKYDAG